MFREPCLRQLLLNLSIQDNHLMFYYFASHTIICIEGIFGYAIATGLGLLAARVLPMIPCL